MKSIKELLIKKYKFEITIEDKCIKTYLDKKVKNLISEEKFSENKITSQDIINELKEIIKLFHDTIIHDELQELYQGLPDKDENQFDKRLFFECLIRDPFSLLFKSLPRKSSTDFNWPTVFSAAIYLAMDDYSAGNDSDPDETEMNLNALFNGDDHFQIQINLLHLLMIPKISENFKDSDLKNLMTLLIEEFNSKITIEDKLTETYLHGSESKFPETYKYLQEFQNETSNFIY